MPLEPADYLLLTTMGLLFSAALAVGSWFLFPCPY